MGSVNFVSSDTGAFLRRDYGGTCTLDFSTIYVFPDVVAVTEARMLLLNDSGVVNGMQFKTLESLASMMVQGMQAERKVLLHSTIAVALAKDVLKSRGTRGAESSGPSLAGAMLSDYAAVRPFFVRDRDWLSEIISGSGVDLPEGVTDRRIRPLEQFSFLFERSMDVMERNGFVDRPRLIEAAASSTGFLSKSGINRVVFLFLTYADGGVISFIEALAADTEVVIVVDREMEELESVRTLRSAFNRKGEAVQGKEPGSDYRLDFFGAPDRRRELTEVARRIKSEIAAGKLKESDFGVLARNIADYDDIARDVFGHYGLRVEGGRKRTLAMTPVCEFTFRFMECLRPESDRKDLQRLMTHELSPVSPDNSRSISDMMELMPEYLDSWRGSFAALMETERRGIRELDVSFIESVLGMRHVAAGSDTLAGWLKTMTGIMSLAKPGALSSTEAVEFALVLNELAAHSAPLWEATGHRDLKLSEFTEIIERFCAAETVPSPAPGGGIRLTDAGIVYLRTFKHCFILGVNDGVFPAEAAEGAFLTHDIIDALASSGFFTRRSTRSHASTEAYYYRRAKSLAASITLSYLTIDAEGRKVLPSRFIIEDCAGDVPSGERLEALDRMSIPVSHFFPGEDENVLSASELRLALSDGLRGEAGFLDEEENSELWKICHGPEKNTFLESVRRMSGAPLPWSLNVERASVAGRKKRLSPSDLNEYAACPFRFFLTRVLRLHPPEGIFGPKSRGTDAHEILKSYFTAMKLDEFRKTGDESISSTVDRLVAERYRKAYGEQCMTELGTVVDMDRLSYTLKRFLKREKTIQSPLSTDIIMIERTFGMNDAPLKIGEYEFRGKIDRVDALHSGSNDLVLFDYKFTSPDMLRSRHFNSKMERIRNFELPVYSLYLRDVLGHRVAGALYYALPKSVGKFDRAGLVDGSKAVYFIPDLPRRANTQISVLSESEMEKTFEHYRKVIMDTASNISEGKFPVAPEKDECNYCSHMSFCRNWGGSDA